MFIKLPTTKKEYVINLDKVLFFYPVKENVTRFELEDGTLLDANVSYDDIFYSFYTTGTCLPFGFPPVENQK